jgi:hypothetical protein
MAGASHGQLVGEGVQRFCAACKSWHRVPAGHLCPVEDGAQTVTVPLAALRALAQYAEDLADTCDREWDGGWRAEAATLVGALGVAGL